MTIQQAVVAFADWRGLKSKPRTINGYVRDLVHFCVFMRDPEISIESITLKHCTDYLQLCRSLGYDENTIQKKAIGLKLLFDYLQRNKHPVLEADLIPIPKKTFRFPRVATNEQYERLMAVIPDDGKSYTHIRNRALIMLLWDTGARNGEITSLELDDLDLDRMSARIKTEKSRGTIPFREVFWRTETNEQLGKWLDAREKFFATVSLSDSNYVFVGIKGGHENCRGSGRRLQVGYVSEILRKYSNKAQLPVPLNPHACRHHMGRELTKKGVNAAGISSILGHSNLASSFQYTMLFGQDREDLYRKNVGR